MGTRVLSAAFFERLEPRRLLAVTPFVIARGGTYSGTWENRENRDPVVVVKTTEPVVIQNSTLRGKGPLIYSATTGAQITVRNSSGFGLNPNIFGDSPGRFITVEGIKSLTVQDNYLESTAGIHVLGYSGNRTTAQTIRVIGNRARNIDGRRSDGANGWLDFNFRTHVTTGKVERGFTYAQFLQLDKVTSVAGIEIAWNEVVNEVGKSRVEDNISLYKSSGTEASPIKIHDNFIEGAYTLRPWQTNYTNGSWRYDWSYQGGGIMVSDGFGTTLNGDPAFVKAFGNTVIGTTNYGVAAASGRETEVYSNRVFSSGKTPDGRWNLQQNVGIYIWDSYDLGVTRFFDHSAHGNTIGWMKSESVRNDWWNPHGFPMKNNIRFPDPITRQTELNEATAWRARRYPPQTPNPTGVIAGAVFKDVDGDGLRDIGDNGIAGFTAWLDLDSDGVKDAAEPTSKSTSTGRYQFTSLKAGKYVVRVQANSGWRLTTSASATLTVIDKQTTTRNFGVSQTPLVSGSVFMDADKDGGFDAGEAGLSGWRVYIDKDADGVFDAGETSMLTDAKGKYIFIGLAPGSHQIRVVGSPNYRLTAPGSGYRLVALSAGEVIVGRNFGEKRL